MYGKLKLFILILFFGLYFILGYSFGKNQSNKIIKKVIDIQQEIEYDYNIEDPNL